MKCPYCGGLDTQVKDSRPTEDSTSIRRRRVCPDCGGRFTTFERVQLRELTVVKSDGEREPFDREKLMRSMRKLISAGHSLLLIEHNLDMIAAAGIDVRTAVRKRESLYAELNLGDATDEQLLDAMAEHPILIERPFVVTDKGTRLARPIDAVREIL